MNLKIYFVIALLFVLVFSSSKSSFADNQIVSLEDFLADVLNSSEEIRATQLDIRSLKFEIQARDLALSPTFEVDYLHFWDDRPSISTKPQTEGESTVLTLSKPFATGTKLNLTSVIENINYLNASPDEQNLLNWQLGITQSLWQDRFGHQTTLRRQRDQQEMQSRLLTLLGEQQKILIDFELLYWDIAYAQQEVKIRKENLERSEQIFKWIEDRFKRTAAERVDYLQGQTLVVSRELQLQIAVDQLKTLQARLNEKLASVRNFTPDANDLQKVRKINALALLLDFAPREPVLLETLQSQAQADYLKAKSQLESDQLKPKVEVGYSYGQQGLSPSFSTARDDAFSRKNDYHQVGISFSVPLDFGLIEKSRRATDLAAQAQDLRSIKFRRQSYVYWDDLKRTISEQDKRVQTALHLAKLQNDKSLEERGRFEKGKTTAFEAISLEQDAADSDLLALQLLTQLRKTEAQARGFTQKMVNLP